MRATAMLAFIFCMVLTPGYNDPLDRAQLLQKLRSDKVDDRVSAYEKLRTDSSALSDPAVKAALIDLLDRESHVALNDDQEGYIEYVSELIETATDLVNWSDQHQVCVLVLSPYPPGDKIASHAQIAMPCLLQKAQSKSSLTRGTAAAMLVQVLGSKTDALDPATVQQARQIILDALQDQAFDVRAMTVEALGCFGRPEMIPALQHVAGLFQLLPDQVAIRSGSWPTMRSRRFKRGQQEIKNSGPDFLHAEPANGWCWGVVWEGST